MRRQTYIFDFRFEISVEFLVEWGILIYDTFWICLTFYICVGVKMYRIWETVTNLKWVIYQYTSFDAKFNADFESEVKNICLPTHLRENRILKKLRRRIQKIFSALNLSMNFDSKYVYISILATSAPLESLMFKKSNFCNYVMLRNRGATKLPSRELCKMLNEMSHSNSVYHLMYLRYYALKFKFRKIDFSQKFASHVTSFFRYLTHFWWWIWWYSQNFKIKTF